MKNEALLKGMKNTPYMVGGVHQNVSDKRSSKVATIMDTSSNLSKKLSQRMELATGLQIVNNDIGDRNSEDLQVMNYGVGGTVQGHLDTVATTTDFYQNEKLMSDLDRNGGERIVTMMMYLSRVAEGGNTVFPQLQLSVRPEPGAVLLWVNVKADGTFDTRSCHLGCPVVYGNKWIANKWIRYHGQMGQLKCKNRRRDSLVLFS